jgi:hypothetical protein
MTLKQFYLLSLFGITFTGGLLLLIIWSQLKRNHKSNQAPLYLSLAMFSWSIVGILKYYDPEIPELVNAIKDRMLSSFSNLFLLASVPYFSIVQLNWSKTFKPFRKKEQWVLNVFIFFAILTVLFTFMDRNVTSNSGRIVIILVDSIISLFSIALISTTLFFSLRIFWTKKWGSIFAGTLFSALILTQIILPLIAIFPGELRPFYPFALLTMLVCLNTFILISAIYFAQHIVRVTATGTFSGTENESLSSLTGIQIGVHQDKKKYYLRLVFSNSITGKEQFTEEVTSNKLLQPFVNWVVFALAKEHGVKLTHPDIALGKFRMVEFWNKQSEFAITQEQLFLNDGGHFELSVDARNLSLSDKQSFRSKFIIRETLLKFKDCFSTKYKTQNDEDLLKTLFELNEFQ